MRVDRDRIHALPTFTKSFLWSVHFLDAPGLGIGSALLSDSLNLRCESIEQPKIESEPVLVNVRGFKVKEYGSFTRVGTITLTFIETVDHVVAMFFKAWVDACQNRKNLGQPSSKDLFGRVALNRLDNARDDIWSFVLEDVILERFDYGGILDGQSVDAIKPSITLGYSDFEALPLFSLPLSNTVGGVGDVGKFIPSF